MQTTLRAIPAILLTCTLVASSTARASPGYAYTVVPLGAGWGSYARAINEAGDVVGRLIPTVGDGAFLYSHGVLTELGALPGENASIALGLNDKTQVVGVSFTSPISSTEHAFLYSGGVMRDIGSLAGGNTSATGINDAGDIVGQSVLQEHFPFAFLYKNGVMQNLSSLPGSDRSGAAAINNCGQIAGTSGVGPSQGPNGNQSHAVLWEHGVIKDLGTLGGLNSYGAAINDRGQVTGYSTLSGGDGQDADYRGFLWSKGKMRELEAPPNGRQVQPNGMNNRADIVGTYQNGGAQRAFVYGGPGRMRDLTALVNPAQGWTITAAYDINDAGQIAGEACNASFSFCTAVRLDPVRKAWPGDAMHGTDARDSTDAGN